MAASEEDAEQTGNHTEGCAVAIVKEGLEIVDKS